MNVHRTKSKGFTLIELMIATTLGLILLSGLVTIVAMVNTSFSDTRVLIDLQNRCRSTQMLLQNDLSHISVTPQPPRPTQADDGYLSLGVSSLTFADTSKTSRGGVALVDPDILNAGKNHYVAFTVFNRENPFSFTDPNDSSRTLQTPYAEVVWFVYKYDLYRVVVPFVNDPETAKDYSTSGWPYVRMISPALLGVPSKRIMNSISNSTITSNQLKQFMVLPNVCHFGVQVYNPKTKQYNDIDSIKNEEYFKGSNSAVQTKAISSFTAYYDTGSFLPETQSNGSTTQNEVYVDPDTYNKTNLVPSTAFLPGMRIIIRSFDPDSGTIRQFRVGQDFRTR